jgi:hypothetical protein
MRRILTLVTAILMCTAAVAQQQAHRPPRILEDKPGFHAVFDDDGGRVETFRRGEAPRELEFHGGAVIREPLAHVVFLGDWSAHAKQRELLLRDFVRTSAGAELRQLDFAGVRHPLAFTGATSVAAADRVNDLRVQSALATAMHDGRLAQRDENVIYVVFIAPETKSTLGDQNGWSDYDSYHSHFHAEDVDVRYVVVPYRGDVSAMMAAASKSVARAIVNPDGDGWY